MKSLSTELRKILAIFSVILFFLAAESSYAQTATNIQVTSTVQQATVHRLGVNLGDQTYWDSGQMLKNLVFINPGFEGLKYRSIMRCASVTASTCTDDNDYSPQPTGYWNNATYTVLSGAAAGTTGKVISSTKNPSSCSGCGQIIQFDKNVNMAFQDYVVLTNSFPGKGDVGWWDTTTGGGTISTETTDLSPNTPGKQALLLDASGSGQSAIVTSYFDSMSGLSFIQMNGNFEVTFRARGIKGDQTLNVSVQRLQTGSAPYLSQSIKLKNSWQDYTLNFTANETGSAQGTVQLVFSVAGSTVELDDVSLDQTNSSASNPTPWRDDVVNALKELNPGTIRMMASGAALGSDIPNQLQVPFARYREGFNTGNTSATGISYGIHEFLQLCAVVKADPWITIPTATTPQEMTDLIEYLTGTGGDSFSALRIARGQSQPWTTVFNKVHLELGNETWNGDFKGEAMTYPAYPLWANQVFGAARATSGFQASKFDLILSGWAAAPGYDGGMLPSSTQHDSFDIAPYLLYSANNEAQSTMFGALFAEPEMYDSPGGEVYQSMAVAAGASRPTGLSVYEANLGTMLGSITQSQLDLLSPSVGGGIAHADHMLQMMRLGIQYQNAFALPQYQYRRNDQSLVRLWGLVVDMGTTNRRRPQFLTQQLANSVIGGSMLQTVQTGANPTWNQPKSSDGVVFNGAHYLQSFAFWNGGTTSTIVFNLSQTSSLPVTFSGPNAPSGNVVMTQITSAKITDNNEAANVVQPVSKTLSGFNPSTGLTLPPFSMTVLTTAGGGTPPAVQSPTFSIAPGIYTTAQTVALSDVTAGATIYYTVNGTTPTTSSTKYTAPITVGTNETINAIATAPGFSASAVASATYTMAAPAATPTFSIPAGMYGPAQNVVLSDATTGAVIYYTTDGTTPTASSNKYTYQISVSQTETLKAIAIAPNYSVSAVGNASYVIGTPAATPTFSVAAGSYSTSVTVALADSSPGSTIYYTTNGNTPTTLSNKYTAPIYVIKTQTLKAIAVANGYVTSAVGSATYTISAAWVETPTFSLAAGSYSTMQTVGISDATSGAVIYYTVNGSTPTTSSTKYTALLKVDTSETIKAIAVTSTGTSAVATATYTIGKTGPPPPPPPSILDSSPVRY